MMKSVLAPIIAISSAVAALPAHAEVVPVNSFVAGFSHPVGGMDHIVAMMAVGVWGVLAGGRALWVWPLAFVSTMLLGFVAAILELSLPWTAAAIFSSIIVLALMVALAVRAPVWVGAAVVGLFAFAASYVVFQAVGRAAGNRVALHAEREGLDVAELGAAAYPDFVVAGPHESAH